MPDFVNLMNAWFCCFLFWFQLARIQLVQDNRSAHNCIIGNIHLLVNKRVHNSLFWLLSSEDAITETLYSVYNTFLDS